MQSSLKLAFSYIWYYKKQSLILFLAISMSVMLLNGIASLLYSNRMTDYKNAKEEYGSWNYRIAISGNLSKSKDISYSGENYHLQQLGFYCSKQAEDTSKDITFCYGDTACLHMTGRTVLEGKYPKAPGEVALDYYGLHNLDMKYSLGSTVKIKGEKYTLTGILSEGAKTDTNSIMVFTDKKTVLDMDGDNFYYLEFSDETSVYEQLEAFVQKYSIHFDDFEMNEGTAIYVGAEPKETIIEIILKAAQLEKGKLIYLLGTLNNNSNFLQKMVFAVIFIFGIFIIHSIFQVIVEKRISQYGILEVLGIEEKNICVAMLAEFFILFLPSYLLGSFVGNKVADALYVGEFKVSYSALYLGFILFALFIIVCCIAVVQNLRQYTQNDKIKNTSHNRSRKIISLKKHNLMQVLSKRFILAKKLTFLEIIISLSLGGVLFICTTYVAENGKQNNIHSMLTDEGLYADISVSITDDDLGKTIPQKMVADLKNKSIKGIKHILPTSYTLGEIPLTNGIFKWTEFYPEVAEKPDFPPDKEIMEKYNGIATKQNEKDYKLKVNVYGYGKEQLNDLSEYLLEGEINTDTLVQNNQVILKQIMDGQGFYDGIAIAPGDHITLKVPKNSETLDQDILKFQSETKNYVEKDFVVAATVSRCTGEVEEFIGAGPSVVGIIMPQQMMESNFGIKDYNNLNINLDDSANSEEVMHELRPLFMGLNQCVVQDHTVDIDKKNNILMQKAYFFYGIAILIFLICLLHTSNSMRHQIQSRRYELGVLRAMGITKQGFCKMLLKEGLFYGMATNIVMILFTLICQKILAGVMQHVVRYIIVSHNLPLLPCLSMILVNIAVCVLVMVLSGSRLLHGTIVDEIR